MVTDGSLSKSVSTGLVVANPVGLYRIVMIQRFGGDDFFSGFGLEAYIPGPGEQAAIWFAWIAGSLLLSVFFLHLKRERT